MLWVPLILICMVCTFLEMLILVVLCVISTKQFNEIKQIAIENRFLK